MKEIFKWLGKKMNEADGNTKNNTQKNTIDFNKEKYFYHITNSGGTIIECLSNNFSDNVYCILDNTSIKKEPRCFYLFETYEISKNKYESLYKNHICNCEIGTGWNIREARNPYSIEEVEKILKEKFPDYNIKYDSEYSYDSLYYHFKISKDNNSKRFQLEKLPKKKACLNCGTCLDEIKDVIKDCREFICKIEEETKINKQIEEICAN